MFFALAAASDPPVALPVATVEADGARVTLLMVTGAGVPAGQWTVRQDSDGKHLRAEARGYDGTTTAVTALPDGVAARIAPPGAEGSWALSSAERARLLAAAASDCVEAWCAEGSPWKVTDVACWASNAACGWTLVETPAISAQRGRSARCTVYAEPPAIEDRPPARSDLVDASGDPASKLTTSITTCLALLGG